MARKIKIDNAELKRLEYKKRKHKVRPVVCRILIVCEGCKTEPNYFKSFDRVLPEFVFDLTCDGGGIETVRVVNKAIELKGKAEQESLPFDRVWAVFDRDSFPESDFNAAILKAEQHGIECAWSNEAFEFWYLLHFKDRITPMSRTEYKNAISEAVNNSPLYKSRKKYEYLKNDTANRKVMVTHGNEGAAIDRAEKLVESYDNQKYATHNPCTTVYRLVRQLTGKDEALNQEIIEKGNMK